MSQPFRFVKVLRFVATTLLPLAFFAQTAQAQTRQVADPQVAVSQYPTRTIKMLVGFPPGGPNDQLARLLALRLSERLKQSIVIENKPGSSGEIAATQAAAAQPDGYTLLFGSSGALTISPSLNSKLPYDPLKDLTPISMVALNPMLLVVSPKSGITSLPDLITRAKAQPGKLTFASAGTGSPTHLSGELFRDIDCMHMRSRLASVQTPCPLYPPLVSSVFQTIQPLSGTASCRLRACHSLL